MRHIYLYIVAAGLILGFLMPQKSKKRKQYILVMTLILVFVSGFRHPHLTGDLLKYHTTYTRMGAAPWLDAMLWNQGKNFGFHYFLKLVHVLTRGNYQLLLILISAIIQGIAGYVIYRYSPAPWMSYLAWNCLGFYIFGFSALKQSLAMAFVMLSFDAICRRNFPYFLICLAIAGAVHMPALIFLPAYGLCRIKVSPSTVLMYLLTGAVLFLFKNPFVAFLQQFYYEEPVAFAYSGSPGNRFLMILGFCLFGIAFSGLQHPHTEKLFSLMAISAMLQMFSGFDNVFTRMTDYYFQLSVLYLPMVFFCPEPIPPRNGILPVFPFKVKSRRILACCLCLFLLWFYYTFNLNITIAHAMDDYLNYRFMWDVK